MHRHCERSRQRIRLFIRHIFIMDGNLWMQYITNQQMYFNQNRIDWISQQSFCNVHHRQTLSIKHTGPDRSEEIYANTHENKTKRYQWLWFTDAQFSIRVQFSRKETTDFKRIIFIFNSIRYQAERKDRLNTEKKKEREKMLMSSFLHREKIYTFFSAKFYNELLLIQNCQLQIKLHRIDYCFYAVSGIRAIIFLPVATSITILKGIIDFHLNASNRFKRFW